MNICVIGAGAIGLLFAGKCSLANHQVYLITRTPEQFQLICEEGIDLVEDDAKHHIALSCLSFEKAADERELFDLNDHFDWIFLTVKQQHINPPMMEFVAQRCKRGAKLVCFQNGIGHIERLQQYIAAENIYVAITSEAALRDKPNQVHHTGRGVTWVGQTSIHHPETINDEKNLVKILQNAGFTTNSSKNINRFIWSKLLINATINPLTAILQVRNGELIQSEDWLKVMKALYDEGRRVADRLQIKLSEQLWDQVIEVCHKTANNKSSMYQDTSHGRKTEIDWINGQIIRMAEQMNLHVPTHQAIYQLVKGMEPPT